MTITRPGANLSRRRRGTEVLELALLMLPLLWLTFGACDFGLYFYYQHNLTSAAREGARAGSLYNARNSDVDSAVKKIMKNAGFKDGSYTSFTEQSVENLDPRGGDDVVCHVEMNYSPIGIPPARVHSTKVSSIVTMRSEGRDP